MRRPAMFVIGLVLATGTSLVMTVPASAASPSDQPAGSSVQNDWCRYHHRHHHYQRHHHGHWNNRDWDDGYWNNDYCYRHGGGYNDEIELHIVSGPTGALT